MKRSVGIVLIIVGLIASACNAATEAPVETSRLDWVAPPGTTSRGDQIGTAAAYATPVALQRFDRCDELLDYVQEHALEVVTPWGLPGYGFGGPWIAEEAAADSSIGGARTSAAPQAGVDYSTTNVQEAGVDEPDLVKTDGERILALANNTLFFVDVNDGDPIVTDSLRLVDSWGYDILMAGDTVLVLGTAQSTPGIGDAARFAPEYYGGTTSTLTQIDISDPGDLRIVSTMYVDGTYLTARMVGDTARVVIDSFPTGLVFEMPEGSGLRAEREALEANRDVIRNSTIENWLPYQVTESADGTASEGVLVSCEAVHHPEDFAGLGTVVVLTLDVGDRLDAAASTAIFAEGGTVYASADNLYVATTRWVDWSAVEDAAPQVTTQIHKFDIADPRTALYRASGEVDGYLLNQFAMSEYEGDLRVATTSSPEWWFETSESSSQVIVLREDGGLLESIGSVGDLGRGERIFSVRFVGELGFVVTFRQTDPLYTIDLSDPTTPRTLGELKINGYSAYLHPLDRDRILGVGQDADDDGRILGSQLSLFDVSDLANPDRLDRLTIEDGYSDVEWDHRAFLYWPQESIAVIPLARYLWDETSETEDYFAGALIVKVTDDRLTEVKRITHAEDDRKWSAQIQRSLVIGDELYTMSQLGLMATSLGNFETSAFVAW